MHCCPHKHKNRIHSFNSSRFYSQESSVGTVEEHYHLGGFFPYKTGQQKENHSEWSDPFQQCTLVCQPNLALLHFFPVSVSSWFHNSYRAVQSLLTVLTYSSLLISVSLKTEALHSPRYSITTGCGVHICLWLLKGFTFRQNVTAKQCHCCFHFI